MGFLDDWLHRQKVKKGERSNELQVISWNGQKQATEIQLAIKTQELELAQKVTELRYKAGNQQADLGARMLELQKKRDKIDRVRAEFKLWLDDQQQELELKRERFYREQARADKTLDNDFTLKMAELQLRREQQEQQHFIELSKLDLQRDLQQRQHAAIEEGKAQRLLDAMRQEKQYAQQNQHTEKMREMDLQAKQFELELAAIRLMSADQQQQAYNDLYRKMQERMSNFNNSNEDIYGSY